MDAPLVSVIVSCFNASAYLAETLDSLLAQTYRNLEIIVVNDGSTDGSELLLNDYEKKGVLVLHQPNKGQDSALNAGFARSRGQYIKYMDADDLINPQMVERQVQVLNHSIEHVAYGEWARFYNNDMATADFTPLNYWNDASPLNFLLVPPQGVMLQCGIMLIPRVLVEKAGGWDDRLILYNDTEFFTRIILASKGVRFSKGGRLYYRSGFTSNISAQKSRKYYESTFLATCLVAQQLLAVEDSYRVRNMVSTMLLIRYQDMYPNYPDLGRQHEQKIAEFGCVTNYNQGGWLRRKLTKMIGWKPTKRVHLLASGLKRRL